MKLMIFKWEGNSYGISLDKLQSANNHIKNIKKIHPFFQDFKIPKKTKSLVMPLIRRIDNSDIIEHAAIVRA